MEGLKERVGLTEMRVCRSGVKCCFDLSGAAKPGTTEAAAAERRINAAITVILQKQVQREGVSA